MHACLDVDEIVRLIACELVASEAKATAVALAGCRKNYEDLVLGALWETQGGLLPLLKSLPGDVWNGNRCTTFKRLPTTPEWARFRKYARRMRKLEGISGLKDMSPEVFSVLQFCAINEPLFPNMRSLELWYPTGETFSFIPLFLSPRVTAISIIGFGPKTLKATVASMIATFPTLCPNLQEITLYSLQRDPMVTAALSEMLLASNRNALRCFRVDYPLTEEARQVVHNLPNLRSLSMDIERDSSLPLVVLPNLTNLGITYYHDDDCLRLFHRAKLEKLGTVTLYSKSEQTGGFLEAFERVVLAASIQNTLSEFRLCTARSWEPNYSSFLPFTQMTRLTLDFSCYNGCSSTVDDDVITNLARAMSRLQTLELGDPPCYEIPTGVTATGLVALAHHCPYLFTLRVHFQVASLSTPLAIPRTASDAEPTALQRGCALRRLEVGGISVPEESVLTVALTLAHIFPHIEGVDGPDEDSVGSWDDNWDKVVEAICVSREIINRSRATLEGTI